MKFLSFVLLVLLGCMVGGLYGILHDQLTYTIAPEYYTRFKFIQFELVEDGMIPSNVRLAVSIVGFFATWWMGLYIGFILALVGFIHDGWRPMLRITSKAFMVTMALAYVTGLIGLAYGYLFLSDKPKDQFTNWYIPEGVVNFSDYIAVGSMHNFSYLGGVIGLVAGMAYSISQKPDLKDKLLWFTRRRD